MDVLDNFPRRGIAAQESCQARAGYPPSFSVPTKFSFPEVAIYGLTAHLQVGGNLGLRHTEVTRSQRSYRSHNSKGQLSTQVVLKVYNNNVRTEGGRIPRTRRNWEFLSPRLAPCKGALM